MLDCFCLFILAEPTCYSDINVLFSVDLNAYFSTVPLYIRDECHRNLRAAYLACANNIILDTSRCSITLKRIISFERAFDIRTIIWLHVVDKQFYFY